MLLPNKHNKSLDIFRIPLSPITGSPSPILRLSLPALLEGDELDEIACRSEPSLITNASRLRRDDGPTSTGPASHPTRAFVAMAKKAICLFSLRIAVPRISIDDGTTDVVPKHGLTFIVHRNALCTLVDEYSKNDSEESEGGHGEKAKGKDKDYAIVPWADWGPPITRWFNTAGYSGGWITTTAGQRYVLMPQDWSLSGVPIYVLDFNEENVRKMKRYYGDREDESILQPGPVAATAAEAQSLAFASLKIEENVAKVGDDEEDDEWETDSDVESEASGYSECVPYIFSFLFYQFQRNLFLLWLTPRIPLQCAGTHAMETAVQPTWYLGHHRDGRGPTNWNIR